MKRLAVAACGLLVGVVVGIGLGSCGQCTTIDRPLSSGTYKVTGRDDYSLVLDLSGSAVETYTYGGKAVRVEYSVGPDTAVP